MQYRIRNGDQLIATVNTKSFHWDGLQPNTILNLSISAYNGLREGSRARITTKTRGIQVVIPKALSVGAELTLIYQEYSLGLVPLGTEPTGTFGGGNRRTIPAKVISSGRSSVVEITDSFNLMTDHLIMKQLADGSFAAFQGYKAIYYEGK